MQSTLQLTKTVYIVFFLDNYCNECSVVRKHQVFWDKDSAMQAADDWENEDASNGFAYSELVEINLHLGTVEFNLNDVVKIGSSFSTDFVSES